MSRKAAHEVLEAESSAVLGLQGQIDESFDRAARLLTACASRLVATGMARSGFIAQQVSATLASTGTPPPHLHPADTIHDNLGRIAERDVVPACSCRGETKEILPYVKRLPSSPQPRSHGSFAAAARSQA